MTPTITAIVIAKNEAKMLANCLETLQWCDDVLVVDHDSSDTTPEIAKRMGARTIQATGSFADIRNEGLRLCKSDWVLYIDADERVIPDLAKEIRSIVTLMTHAAYQLKRSNIMYGHILNHGGWEQDAVVRLFKREALEMWAGEIHEHAVVSGTTGQLDTQLLHLTHRSIVQGLLKTAEWTPLEAKLLHQANIPPVNFFTILRKGGLEIFRRAILKQGYKDGLVGWVESLVQGMNRMLVYLQVWELQQKPSLPERYQKYEVTVAELWKRQTS